jgi:hypothetical protein
MPGWFQLRRCHSPWRQFLAAHCGTVTREPEHAPGWLAADYARDLVLRIGLQYCIYSLQCPTRDRSIKHFVSDL